MNEFRFHYLLKFLLLFCTQFLFYKYAQAQDFNPGNPHGCHINANERNWAAPYQSLHSYATRTQTSEIVPLALHDYGGRNINSAHDTLTLKAHY